MSGSHPQDYITRVNKEDMAMGENNAVREQTLNWLRQHIAELKEMLDRHKERHEKDEGTTGENIVFACLSYAFGEMMFAPAPPLDDVEPDPAAELPT